LRLFDFYIKALIVGQKLYTREKSLVVQQHRNIYSVDIFFHTNIRHGVIEKDFCFLSALLSFHIYAGGANLIGHLNSYIACVQMYLGCYRFKPRYLEVN